MTSDQTAQAPRAHARFSPKAVALSAAAFAVLGASAVVYLRRAHEQAEREKAAEQQRAARAQASAKFMPDGLAGITLGLSEAALKRARPGLFRHEPADEPSAIAYAETLGSGKVFYFVNRDDHTLSRVQQLSTLAGMPAIPSRLRGRQTRLGPAAMAFDCPPVPGKAAPMRRFIWLDGEVAGADSFLILRDRVSATWSTEARRHLFASLGQGGCTLVTADRVAKFPSVTP